MKTFYFNTGVKQFGHFPPVPLMEGQVWRGGVKQIPFDCEDVPKNATFAFACDDPKLHAEAGYIVREMHNTIMASKYAYFTH